MTTPHRGLPVPAGMTLPRDLPDPTRQTPSLPPPFQQPPPLQPQPQQQQHGQTPGPSLTQMPLMMPHGSQSQTETMKDFFYARAEEEKRRQEEEKRKQEEEKRKQEELRLEQRKIESDMLIGAIQGGVPAHLVPLIFAGLSGGPLAQAGLELAQHHLAQIQQQAQQQAQAYQSHSADRRDARPATQPQFGILQQTTMSAPGSSGQAMTPNQQAAGVYPSPAYHSPRTQSKLPGSLSQPFAPTNAVPKSTISSLPRLTTNEAQALPAPSGPTNYGAVQSAPTQVERPTSPSPSIYFHHWQPPSAAGSNATGGKESGKDSASNSGEMKKTSPKNPHQVHPSPRKRKAVGPHQPAPVPSSVPGGAPSPTFSNTSTNSRNHGHSRQNSERTPPRHYDPVRRASLRRSASQEDDEKPEASTKTLSPVQSFPVSQTNSPEKNPVNDEKDVRQAVAVENATQAAEA